MENINDKSKMENINDKSKLETQIIADFLETVVSLIACVEDLDCEPEDTRTCEKANYLLSLIKKHNLLGGTNA